MFACSPGCAPIRSTSPGSSAELKKVPNLLQHDNVLCIVVEFDTRRVLDPGEGLAVRRDRRDDVPARSRQASSAIAAAAHRLGRAARADQHAAQQPGAGRTSTTCATCGISRRRSRSPRSCSPCSCKRLMDSLAELGHARRQGRLDAGSARRQRECLPRRFPAVRRGQADHRHKPPRDREEHARRAGPTRPAVAARSTRTSIDILLTWLVNRDREFLQGGATGATKPGMNLSLFRDAEHGTADRGRERRSRRAPRSRSGR